MELLKNKSAKMERALVFIESNTTGTGRLFAQAARREGCVPILIASQPARYPFAEEDEISVLKHDTNGLDDVLAACNQIAEQFEIVGVASTSDYFVAIAASVASILGLPGPSPQGITATRDKELQYKALAARDVSVPKSALATSLDQAQAISLHFGLPVVLKPVAGSGSVGVKLCRTPEEVIQHAACLLGRVTNERGIPIRGDILIQEYIDGPEYSVEALNGKVIGVTRKHLSEFPYFVEIGHDFPADIPSTTQASIEKIVNSSLKALDLTWGAAHVELRLGSNGPVIIEVNPRLAGGMIPQLVRHSTGIDMISGLVNLIIGKEPQPRGHHQPQNASIRFLLPTSPGKLAHIKNTTEAAALPHIVEIKIYRDLGSKVEINGDFRDRVGHVISCALREPDAVCAAVHAVSLIELVIKPD